MTRRRKWILALGILGVLLVALIIWTIWGNTALEQNAYEISTDQLPAAFDGFRIAHISDLHNAQMGADNEKLLSLLRDAEPDMIAITGDLIDSRRTDTAVALHFVREAMQIAPCYYVTGNHEARVAEYEGLKAAMEDAGVIVLDDERAEITIDGQCVTLVGLNDPSFQTDYLSGDDETVVSGKLAELCREEDGFTILLSHRPELFEVYAESGVDLVLSGHAHGGQFRLPFVGGLAAPNQGFFPEYDGGLYTKGNTNMLVSRGVGNSIMPIRFNNRPEVILIELHTQK